MAGTKRMVCAAIAATVGGGVLLWGVAASAQHSPYVGQQNQKIKSLGESDIEGYETGRGMGLARAAELNGYPGPMHVLEASKEVRLTEAQAATVKAARLQMLAEAVPLGRQIVEKEAQLDRLFTSGSATDEAVNRLTGEIGTLQGALRAVHLRAHLRTKDALTPEQVARYNKQRGYR